MERNRVQLFASQRFIELLRTFKDHRISSTILSSIRVGEHFEFSYLDFGSTMDTVSFIYSNKIEEMYNNSELSPGDMSNVWKTGKRSEIKIGKFVKLMFRDNFPINRPKSTDPSVPYEDIESFVNSYKCQRNKETDFNVFSIVSGNELLDWYNVSNYTDQISDSTPLGRSCLRYDESRPFLEMYLLNQDKVSMLMLKDSAGKLRARALLWKLDEPFNRVYMDRVYFVNDWDANLFVEHAQKNGWLYKSIQTYGWGYNIIDPLENQTPKKLDMKVKLTDTSFQYYPYLDTLSVYNRDTGELCNDGSLLSKSPYIHLIDYRGSYEVQHDDREYVYSRYYNEEIPKDEAIYCEVDDDWVYERDKVYIFNTGGLNAVRGSDRIVKSNILGKEKYFMKDRCVFSEFLNTWVFVDSVKNAYIDKDKKKEIIIHRKMVDKYFEKDTNGDLLIKEEFLDEFTKKKDMKVGSSLVNTSNGTDNDNNVIDIEGIFGTNHNSQYNSFYRVLRGSSLHGIPSRFFTDIVNDND